MEYRSLGKSDIKVSELAFGAWAIGGWLWGGADFRLTCEKMDKTNKSLSDIKLKTNL